MPKAIKSYIIFTVVVSLLAVFFFSSNLIIGDTRTLKNEGYNQTIKLEGWDIKISNASYDNVLGVATFDYFVKEKEQNKSSKPIIYKVSTSKNTSKELAFTSTSISNNELGTRFTVEGVESNFYYLRVFVKTKVNDYQPPDTVDDFGNIIKHDLVVGKETEYWINIDYRSMQGQSSEPLISSSDTNTTSSSEEANVIVTSEAAQETITATQTQSTKPPVASAEATRKPVEITPSTKAPVTTPPTSAPVERPITNTLKPADTTMTTTSAHKPVTISTTSSAHKPVTTTAPKTTATTIPPVTTPPVTLPPIPVTSIKLQTSFTDNNVKIKVGESALIRAVISPAQATNQNVTWQSNKPTIAYVDKDGKVLARSPGVAIITAKSEDGNLSAACMVTVK